MVYEYSGYLKAILSAPDEAQRDQTDHIAFGPDDLAHWTTTDLPAFTEWLRIPVSRSRTDHAVELKGKFEDVRRIDYLASDEPTYWVPLGTLGVRDDRFPIDLNRFPILEITCRCTSQNARLACAWAYPGGLAFDAMHSTQQWRTIARKIQHNGFPAQLDALILRLYSTVRATESAEIREVRFRAMTPREAEACEHDDARLECSAPPPRAEVLDEFVPLGVFVDAQMAQQLAQTMGISVSEYWQLLFEDVVRHHQNCVAIENAERFTREDWKEMHAAALEYGVRFVPLYGMPLADDPALLRDTVDELVRANADVPGLLAWGISTEPREQDLPKLLQVRDLVYEADPRHPFVITTRNPGKLGLLAPHFAAVGVNHFHSRNSWGVQEVVETHLNLSRGQQFWVVAPGFVWGSGAPEWSTCPELRLMVNSAFAAGGRGFFTYLFHNVPIWIGGSCQRTLTGPFLTFSDLWQELDQRMERINAMAPLILGARPEPIPEGAYTMTLRSEEKAQLPNGVPLTTASRLRGDGYNLFFLVSHDIRGMASINLSINPDFVEHLEIYDLSDFIQDRHWERMPLDRHLEMFPGQAHVFLIAPPDTCRHFRDVVAHRLMEDDRRQLAINMRLARQYSIDVSPVEEFLEEPRGGDTLEKLSLTDWARDRLLDLIYENPEISDARSRIIEVSAALCACDGALCRLHSLGKTERARELGLKVLPIARELAHMRLELRHGRGKLVLDQTRGLSVRALELVNEIRAQT